MKKTLIFDLDGTVLNTLKDLKISANIALNYYNYPQKSLEEIRNSVGDGLKMLIRRVLPMHTDEETVDAVLAKMKEHYRLHCHDATIPYPGIPELLARLKTEGYRIALVSNKADAMTKELHRVFFAETIDLAIGETERLQRKPAPDMVFEALRLLGADKNDAICIGDSEVDVLTAKSAGLPCLSVSWGFRSETVLLAAGAKTVCHTPEELYKAIKGS
ncbi:MAG: HAD family hydrolase [Oscillospiraceae bacterium]|nr:HAD family hydrolase [Oscillospiraceae bacterium]